MTSDESHAPGRKVMRRHNGRADVYWVAAARAVKAGWTPKTLKLADDPGERDAPPEVAARCRRMWAEMLEFLAGASPAGAIAPTGTISWLIDLYQNDEESPYFGVAQITREGYDKSLAILRETVGDRRIDAVSSKDVRRWHRLWGRADTSGQLANPRRAYGCVQVLRIIVKHGRGLRNAACKELSEILTETEFSPPRGRKRFMTRDHVERIIVAAHEAGSPSIARAVAIQFSCFLRQKDVIGSWESTPDGRQWMPGLRWGEHISADWRLTKATSKSRGQEVAEFDLRLLPLAMQELGAVLATSRIGPVIIDEHTGRPYIQREFARRFRAIARAAGVPDDIWNMDARAGSVTHAYDSGAAPADAMAAATHQQMATNLRYRRATLEQTSRVSRLRFGDVECAKNDASNTPSNKLSEAKPDRSGNPI